MRNRRMWTGMLTCSLGDPNLFSSGRVVDVKGVHELQKPDPFLHEPVLAVKHHVPPCRSLLFFGSGRGRRQQRHSCACASSHLDVTESAGDEVVPMRRLLLLFTAFLLSSRVCADRT